MTDLATRIAGFVTDVTSAMGLELDARVEQTADAVRVELEGEGGEWLVRRGGEALDALQHLANSAFRKQLSDARHIVVDCLGFRRSKDAELRQMAKFLVSRAKETGEPPGDRPPQLLRPPDRPPDRGRASRHGLREHRRRRDEDRHHLRPPLTARTPQAQSDPFGGSGRQTVFAVDDTIVAIATPPGRGAIGVVRISGPDAAAIASVMTAPRAALRPRYATLTSIRRIDRDRDAAIDRVLVTYFPQPASYTGQDVVEISGHGSPVLLQQIVDAALERGARLARPGEFTLRAFLNGRLDLVQAEAVGDLVEAVTPRQARAAFDQLTGGLSSAIEALHQALFDLVARLEASLDFPEEGYHFADPASTGRALRDLAGTAGRLIADGGRGRVIREGRLVAILGRPNVGKSTIFNLLAGADRAIVTDVPGTTRDLITETIEVDGIPVTLVDTAGLRPARDPVEREGVSRARRAGETAEVKILVFDQSRPLQEEDRWLLEGAAPTERLVLANKSDLPAAWGADDLGRTSDPLVICARAERAGDAIRGRLASLLLCGEPLRDEPRITNVRHVRLLERVEQAIGSAAAALEMGRPEEFVLADLQEARSALEEITGRTAPEDLLAHIFGRFCIGK
jgi:tRNA modification GTPase